MPKFFKTLLISVLLLAVTIPAVSAEEAYVTYTYSYNGDTQPTPHAYTAEAFITGKQTGAGDFLNPSDIFVDEEGTVLVSDSGNNRIVFLNPDMECVDILSEFSTSEGMDALKDPRAAFRAQNGHLFVADTGNARIVEFDPELQYVRSVGAPETNLLAEGFAYKPTAVAVDAAGRLYVVAESVNMGILQFSGSGDFEGFLGAQKVTYNVVEYLWKQILTKEQQLRMDNFVPTEYNNICMDEDGFLYATSSAIDETALKNDIYAPSKTPAVSPIKRLNPSGYDVLKRTGNLSISGDINFRDGDDPHDGVSSIIDVALGEAKTYTLLDRKRNRYFTYSQEGRLLFAFGIQGTQLGATNTPVSIAYLGSDFLVLDKVTGGITRYDRTTYGDQIIAALEYQNNYDYEQAVEMWERVIQQNPNSEIGYNGMGIALMNDENYEEALDLFMTSYDVTNYSKAYREVRNEWVRQYILLILAGCVLLVWGLMRLSRYIRKRNRSSEERYQKKRLTLGGRLLYSFHTAFHPFDGFYDIKFEKRGSVASATVLLAAAIVTLLFKEIFTGFVFNPKGYLEPVNFMTSIAAVVAPVALWTVSNWCLTTLLNGEGTLKDIYVSTCYALLPLILLLIPATIISNFIALEEAVYVQMFETLAYFWTGLLIFFGSMTIHQYSLPKTIICVFLTLIGIVIILFLILLIFTTLQQISRFINDLWKELAYRM